MALPTKSDLLSLDYVLDGSPYVEVTAGGSADTSLDYSYDGNPFVVLATSGETGGAVKEAAAALTLAFSQTAVGSEIADAASSLTSTASFTATISHIEGADLILTGFATVSATADKNRLFEAALSAQANVSADAERIPAAAGEVKEFNAEFNSTASVLTSGNVVLSYLSTLESVASVNATISHIEGADLILNGFASVTVEAQRVSIVDAWFAAESTLDTVATVTRTVELSASASSTVSITADRIATTSVEVSSEFQQSSQANKIADAQGEFVSEFTQTATISHLEGADLFAMSEAALEGIVSRLRDNNIAVSDVFDVATDFIRYRATESDEVAEFTVSADFGRNRDYNSEIAVAFSFACDIDVAILAELDAFGSATLTADINRIRRSQLTVSTASAVSSTATRLKQFNTLGFTPRTSRTLTVNGNTVISTAQKQVGAGSVAFDGSGDNIVTGNNLVFAFNTSWTVEFWFRRNNNSATHTLVDFRSAGNLNNLRLQVQTNGFIYTYFNNGIRSNYLLPTNNNVWTHVAVVFNNLGTSDSWNQVFYVNGVQRASRSIDIITFTEAPLTIGSTYLGTEYLNGFIDEVRVSNTARYTSAFTPSTTAFNNDANTVFLLHGDTVLEDDDGPLDLIPPGIESEFTQVTDARIQLTVQLEGTLFAQANLSTDINVVYGGVSSQSADAGLTATISHIEGADLIINGFAQLTANAGVIIAFGVNQDVNNFIVNVVNPQYYRGFDVELDSVTDTFINPLGFRTFDSSINSEFALVADNLILNLVEANLDSAVNVEVSGDRFRLGVVNAGAVAELSASGIIPVEALGSFESIASAEITGGFLQGQLVNTSSEFQQVTDANGFRVFDTAISADTNLQAAITNVKGIDVVIFDFATMTVSLVTQKRGNIDAVVDTDITATVLKTTQGQIDANSEFDLDIDYLRRRDNASSLSSEFALDPNAEIFKPFDLALSSTTALTLDTVQAGRNATVNAQATAEFTAQAQKDSDNDIAFNSAFDSTVDNARLRGVDSSLAVSTDQTVEYTRFRDVAVNNELVATQDTFAVKTVEAIVTPMVLFDTAIVAVATMNQVSIMIADTAMTIVARAVNSGVADFVASTDIEVNEVIVRNFDTQTFMEFISVINAVKIVIGSGTIGPNAVPGEPPVVVPEVFASQFTQTVVANKITFKQFNSELAVAFDTTATALRTLQFEGQANADSDVTADQIRIRNAAVSISSAFSPTLTAGAVRNDSMDISVTSTMNVTANKIVFVGGPGIGGNSVVGNAIIESDLLNFTAVAQQTASLAKMLRSSAEFTAFYTNLTVGDKETGFSANINASSTLVAENIRNRLFESHLDSDGGFVVQVTVIETVTADLVAEFSIVANNRQVHILEYVYTIPAEGRTYTINSETRLVKIRR